MRLMGGRPATRAGVHCVKVASGCPVTPAKLSPQHHTLSSDIRTQIQSLPNAICVTPAHAVAPHSLVSTVVPQSVVDSAGQKPSLHDAAAVAMPPLQLAARHSTSG